MRFSLVSSWFLSSLQNSHRTFALLGQSVNSMPHSPAQRKRGFSGAQFVIITDTPLKTISGFWRARSSNTGHPWYHGRHEHVTDGNERIHRGKAPCVCGIETRQAQAHPRRSVRNDGLLAQAREPAADREPEIQGAQRARAEVHGPRQGDSHSRMARGGMSLHDLLPRKHRRMAAGVPHLRRACPRRRGPFNRLPLAI